MKRFTGFQRICAILAAINCYNSGQTVEEIAASAKRSPGTVRRWLQTAPHLIKRR